MRFLSTHRPSAAPSQVDRTLDEVHMSDLWPLNSVSGERDSFR